MTADHDGCQLLEGQAPSVYPHGVSQAWHGRNDWAILRTLLDDPDWLQRTVLDRLAGYPDPAVCWPWPGTTAKGNPQGRLPVDVIGKRGTGVSVRRVLWLAMVGPISPGEVVHIGCGNSLCCNPAHAITTTFWAMMREDSMHSPTAEALRRSHCPRGHSLTPENNLPHLAGRGWRGCRTCLSERHALIRAAAKVTGLTWKGYAAGHGLSRAEAIRVLAEVGNVAPPMSTHQQGVTHG